MITKISSTILTNVFAVRRHNSRPHPKGIAGCSSFATWAEGSRDARWATGANPVPLRSRSRRSGGTARSGTSPGSQSAARHTPDRPGAIHRGVSHRHHPWGRWSPWESSGRNRPTLGRDRAEMDWADDRLSCPDGSRRGNAARRLEEFSPRPPCNDRSTLTAASQSNTDYRTLTVEQSPPEVSP